MLPVDTASAAIPGSGPFGSAAAQSGDGPPGQRSGSWRVAGVALNLLRTGRTRSGDAALRRPTPEGSGGQLLMQSLPRFDLLSAEAGHILAPVRALAVVRSPAVTELLCQRRPAADAVTGGLGGALWVGTIRAAVARLRPAAFAS